MTGLQEAELIPVSILAEYAYCPRSAYIHWIQGEQIISPDVIEGKIKHRNVDKTTGTKKLQENTDDLIHTSSIMLSDNKLGIIAKIDRMEKTGNKVTPVEYKRGQQPKLSDKLPENHLTQLCAQALLLRANGYECTVGIMYYMESKVQVKVTFTHEIVAKTLQYIYDMKQMIASNTIPAPLVDSPKCPRCSLVGICLPDETLLLSNQNELITRAQVRRMYPVRSDTVPVSVQEQGAYIAKAGEVLKIKTVDGRTTTVRLIDVSDVNVFGNVQISTQAIREMCARNIPICYFSYGGWFTGMVVNNTHKNIELRIMQHKKYHEKNASLQISREIVHGKIKNCTTLLRRNLKVSSESVLIELERLSKRVKTVKKYDALLGLEGFAARAYFSVFSKMLNTDTAFDFTGRNRRPPKDPINAMLSFVYSMLVKDATIIVNKVGLDPLLGYLHKPKYGKPALALDIIEEFRPVIGDSVCIALINTKQVTDADFVVTEFGVNMTSAGRQKIIAAYDARMNSGVLHPLLGYSASYKRIMETQVRLLSRYLSNEIPSYRPFKIR